MSDNQAKPPEHLVPQILSKNQTRHICPGSVEPVYMEYTEDTRLLSATTVPLKGIFPFGKPLGSLADNLVAATGTLSFSLCKR